MEDEGKYPVDEVRRDAGRPAAPEDVEPPRTEERRPPFDLTRLDLRKVEWRDARDLAVLGYKLGDTVSGGSSVKGTSGFTVTVAEGLELRTNERHEVEVIFVSTPFAPQLVGAVAELLVEFRPDDAQALFGVASEDPEMAELRETLEKAGVAGFDGRTYAYPHLGIDVRGDRDGYTMLRLYKPAARR